LLLAEAINKSPQLLTSVDLWVLIFFFRLIFEERSSDLSKSVKGYRLVEGKFAYFIAIPWLLGYEKVMAGMPTVVAVDRLERETRASFRGWCGG
jgi:hypothetical protein